MHPVRAASFVHTAAVPLAAVPGWPSVPEGVVLDRVVGVAVDSRGRIYFSHRGDRPLWRLHPDGRFDREIGGDLMRKTTAYDLRGPTPKPIATKCWMHGLHVDAADNVWVTDVGRHLVMKFSPEGRLLMVLGSDGQTGCGPTVFNQPTHVCVVPSGEFYVTDGYGNSRVVRFAADGRYLGEWGGRGTGAGEFHTPHIIVHGPDGRLYVSDRENDRIQVFDLDGRVLAVWEGLHSLDGLCFGPDGNLYASCGIDHAIVRIDPAGQAVESWARPGDLIYPHALAFDGEGLLLAAETGDRCRIVSRRAEEHFVAEPRTGPEGSRLSRWRLKARA